jgi:hypothetical protein
LTGALSLFVLTQPLARLAIDEELRVKTRFFFHVPLASA